MKTDLFQSCGQCWVFHICWHIECSTLTASSFSIWNSSVRLPSPLLAVFIVMLPKAHLTSHSKMSGFRWVITPSWFSGSVRPFVYSPSGYSCHLHSYSSASVLSISVLLSCTSSHEMFLSISNFLEELSRGSSGITLQPVFNFFNNTIIIISLRKPSW